MRHAQKIQHGPDQIQMGDQDGLRQILGEILVAPGNTFPEFWHGFAQTLRVDLGEVRANFESLVDLVRFQLADGDAADELRSEEHTSELQSLRHLVCRLLLEKKKTN